MAKYEAVLMRKLMMTRRTLILAVPALAASSVLASNVNVVADMVLKNGKIYTVNPQNIWAEVIAISNGTII